MLSDEIRARVVRQVKSITEQYRTTKAAGYNFKALALPTFDSQEDFDLCRPEDKGRDFREHNEFTTEVLTGLLRNGVPVEPVVFYHAEFLKGLGTRPIGQESRAEYGAYLLAEVDRLKNE